MRLNVTSLTNGLEFTGIFNEETAFNLKILTSTIISFSAKEIVYDSGVLQINETLYESIYINDVLSTPSELYDFINSFVNPA